MRDVPRRNIRNVPLFLLYNLLSVQEPLSLSCSESGHLYFLPPVIIRYMYKCFCLWNIMYYFISVWDRHKIIICRFLRLFMPLCVRALAEQALLSCGMVHIDSWYGLFQSMKWTLSGAHSGCFVMRYWLLDGRQGFMWQICLYRIRVVLFSFLRTPVMMCCGMRLCVWYMSCLFGCEWLSILFMYCYKIYIW